jgi:hypothetical protein
VEYFPGNKIVKNKIGLNMSNIVRRSGYLFLIYTILILSCNKEDEFKENILLKNRLEGTWIMENDQHQYMYRLTFNGNKVSWYDSIVNVNDSFGNGEIQSSRGNCPVKYSFRDGKQYYNPYNTTHVYSFSGTTENDILWVFILDGGNSIIRDYSVTNNLVKFEKQWKTPDPIGGSIETSYVKFKNDFKIAEFCIPLSDNTSLSLGEFTKQN